MTVRDWGFFRIHVGDCLATLASLPAGLAQTVVTSPPYFGLRDYGVEGQIGLEPTPDEYVAKMVTVFREVRRVLRDDGTLWLNLGDAYVRAQETNVPQTKYQANAYPTHAKAGSSDGETRRGERPGVRVGGLAPKQLLGIPWRVAFALQADGWYLRQDIIWEKPNTMPESVDDRCTKAHEYLFLLSKRPRYYFDHAAIKEPAVSTRSRGNKERKPASARGVPTNGRGSTNGDVCGSIPWGATERRNRRSVWSVATRPFKEAHFATYPPELIEPCILAGSKPGDVVLDPFGGAGTTALVAARKGRVGVLCELNPEYVAIAEKRLVSEFFGPQL